MSRGFDFEYRSVPDSQIGTMQCSLCQKPIYSGDFRAYKKNQHGDWGYLVQHRACTRDDPQWAKIDAERARVPGLFDVGGYVGDIFFGDPDNSTRGTHRWDGSDWVELPDERVTLVELLAKSRARVEKLGEAAKDLNAAIDAMWNEGPTSDPEIHRLAITRAQRDLRLALEGR